MFLELEETRKWIRDDDVDDETLEMLIGASEQYLYNATGRVFDRKNFQARLFCLVLVADWNENRDLIGAKVSEKVRFIVQSMLLQLQYSEEGDVTNG